MLDFGGVLGLVHTEVGVAAAELLQKLRELAQNPVGVDHLVVVVHELVGAQQAAVLLVDGRKLHPLHLYLFQIFTGNHAVFHIGDGGLYRLDGALRGKFPALPPADLSDDGRLASSVLQQLKGLAALGALIGPNDSAAYSVNGAKLQPVGQGLAEKGGEAPGHIPGGGDGVGHGEDVLRRHALGDEVANAGDQYRGLAAARHCQQQNRSGEGLNGLFLLGVKI